jgi:hypothetical protein
VALRHYLRSVLLWSLVAVSVSASAAAIRLSEISMALSWADDLFVFVSMLGFVVVGGLIVHRRPGNRIGWMMAVAGASFPVVAAMDHYVRNVHALGGKPPAMAVWAAWVSGWLWAVPVLLIFGFLPVLFPDGRLPSPRWRPLLWAGFALVVYPVALAVRPGPMYMYGEPIWDNPVGIAALGEVPDMIDSVAWFLIVTVLLGVVAAVFTRWRRSREVERQQMKWFLAATGVLFSVFLLEEVLPLPEFPFGIVLLGFPVAVGIAVLRYRLYDIDRIVSRTVTYGLLTAVLVGVYALGVLGLGGVVRSVTGGAGGDLVVAASTLAVAALFVPARRRIQASVDRRFNRARYDAQRTVEAFAQRLRDEIDVEVLTTDLAEVAATSLRPAHASVWLTAGNGAGVQP